MLPTGFMAKIGLRRGIHLSRKAKRRSLKGRGIALPAGVERLEDRSLLSAAIPAQIADGGDTAADRDTLTASTASRDLSVVSLSTLTSTADGTGGDSLTADSMQTTSTAVTRQSAPVLLSTANQVIWGPDAIPGINVFGSDPFGQPLTFTAQIHNLEWAIDQQFGLFTTGNLHRNWGGINEIWLRGRNNEWYFVTEFGQMVLWDGSNRATGSWVMDLDPVVNANPALLHSAVDVNPGVGVAVQHTSSSSARLNFNISPFFQRNFAVTVNVFNPQGFFDTATFAVFQEPSRLNRDLDAGLGLRTTGNLHFNWGGQLEKWILGDAGWYFIVPNGDLYLWDRTPNLARGTAVANAGFLSYEHPEILHNGQNRLWDAYLDIRFTGNFHFNWGGLQEKWVRGGDGQWYFIRPDGRFIAWDGSPQARGRLIDILSFETYVNPALLYNALEESPLSPIALASTNSTTTNSERVATDNSNSEHDYDRIDTAFSDWYEEMLAGQARQERPTVTLSRSGS